MHLGYLCLYIYKACGRYFFDNLDVIFVNIYEHSLYYHQNIHALSDEFVESSIQYVTGIPNENDPWPQAKRKWIHAGVMNVNNFVFSTEIS